LRLSRKWKNPENQPEREILGNGENPEICIIRNNKQKCTKPELPKDPAKRKKSQEKKIQEQNRASKSNSRTKPKPKTYEETRVTLGAMGNAMRAGRTETGEITSGCVDRVGCVLRCCDTMWVTICKAWAAICGRMQPGMHEDEQAGKGGVGIVVGKSGVAAVCLGWLVM